MSKFLCISLVRREPISDEEVRTRMSEIHYQFFRNISKPSNRRFHRIKALRGIIGILRDSKRYQLHQLDPRDILSCSIKILAESASALHEPSKTCEWKRRRDYKIARKCYQNIVRSFVPEKFREIVHSLMEVISLQRLWHCEDLCLELIIDLTEQNIVMGSIINALLDRIETNKTSIHDARAIVRILYEILNEYSWPKTNDTVTMIERILRLYYESLNDSRNDDLPIYASLRKGLEVSLRNTIENLTNEHLLVVVYHMCAWSILDNANDATILDFGDTLEYAAHKHVTHLYEDTRVLEDTLNEKIFPLLMRMISSSNRLVSLLGNRVVHHLIDRRDNKSLFRTPRIFFENEFYDVQRVDQCEKRDKRFLQANREILHDSLIKGAMRHSSTRLNLESVYCTICLLAIEVPCGFTAAAVVCLVMNLQDITLEKTEILRDVACHIHATVMSVMSLLCWLHDARVFYTYVNKIMIERAQWSPHLNPPLKSRYSHAVHHVLWDKPELFFVDWEARYGLWKCFRQRDDQRRSNDTNVGGSEDQEK